MNGQTLKKAFVPLPGQAIAVYTSSGLDHYRHSDWLGSTRLTSTPSRTVSSTVAYAPFGETYAQSGTADPSFTGMNSDTTSGDYDFPARYYSIQGRWPSPDPAGLAAVDPSNPHQSWNRYAYVRNNPLSYTDPTGEDLYLSGDTDWLLNNVLYPLAGSEEAFNSSYQVDENGQVLFNGNGVPYNSGQQLINDLLNSTDNYLWFAGTSGKDAAALFKDTFKDNGKPTDAGKKIALDFDTHGTAIGLAGRPGGTQPADLANGDSVYSIIDYNTRAVGT